MRLLGFAWIALLFACDGKTPEPPKPDVKPQPDATKPDAPKPAPVADGVTVKGRVTFKGTPPKRRIEDTGSDPKCHEEIRSEEVVVENGNLANVFVYVKNPPKADFAAPSTPVVLDQKGCRYEPHVFGIMVGQHLVIRNSDGTTHNVHKLGGSNPEFNKGMEKGAPDIHQTFKYAGKPEKFKCDIHGWMAAWMHVMKHPYFAVSAADGTFSIRDLPPGEYQFEAWHEKFGTLTKQAKVPGDELTFEFENK